MSVRRQVRHVVLALAVLAPLACASSASRGDASRYAPANAPARLLATGDWWGEAIGSPPEHLVAATVARARTVPFEVEVRDVRDSASLTFVLDARRGGWVGATVATGAGAAAARDGGSDRPYRLRPTAVMIHEEVMLFQLPRAPLGWTDLSCRLERRAAAGTWEGPCVTDGDRRALVLTLQVPLAETAAR